MTDAMKLGIKAPVRMSGDLAGSPGCKLIGPAGELELSQGVIVAARHIHMAGDQAEAYGLHDGDRVSVRVQSARPCVWGDVIIRAGKGHDLEMHVDTDEANSALLSNGAYVELVADTAACQAPVLAAGCRRHRRSRPLPRQQRRPLRRWHRPSQHPRCWIWRQSRT